MKKIKSTFIAICIMAFAQIFAQETKEIQVAFAKSYNFESKYQYDDAIKVIKEVYVESSYPMSTRLAWLYYLKLDYSQSTTYYQKAINLMPNAVEPLWAILAPQADSEKWFDVEKTYLSILKLDPKNTTAHYKLGMIYYYRKNYSTAKKYFDIYLTQFPLDYDALLMSAWAHYYLGTPTEAKSLFTRVLTLYQNDASALQGLSLIKI